MIREKKNVFGRMLAAVLLGVWLLLLCGTVSAEKTDWSDKSYDFSRVRRALVYDMDFSAAAPDSQVKERKYQSDFLDYTKKMKCEVVTYDQALRRISLELGVDLDALMKTDPDRADALFRENLSRVADVWIDSRTLLWKNDYYIVPERTVWEERRMSRRVRGRDGHWFDEYYYITVPVTYPAHRVDVSSIKVSFEVYDAKTGRAVLGREDSRDREGYDEHDGMYERICKSFFGDFGNKLH